MDRTQNTPSEVTEEVLLQLAKTQNTRNKVARQQVIFTLCGVALIIASFVIVFVVVFPSLASTEEALHVVGLDIRKRVTGSILDEVAVTLRPVYSSTRRLSEQAFVGTLKQDPIWPPTRETFENNYTDIVATLWIQLEHDLHVRHMEADGSGKEYIPFLDVSAQLALQADWQTPATSVEDCAHLLRISLNAGSVGEDFANEPEKTLMRTVILMDENVSSRRYQQQFDTINHTVNPAVDLELQELSCEQGMSPFQVDHPFQEVFANFSWHGHGPLGTEADGFIYGSAPFYSADGTNQHVGIFSSSISVHKSLNPALHQILQDGGQFTRGAQVVIISESGTVLGESEFSDESRPDAALKYTSTSDLPRNSQLSMALRDVYYKTSSPCPEQPLFFQGEDDYLINAVPFLAEEHGMPPLNEKWCVIATVPRRNIYDTVDDLQVTTIALGCVNLVTFLGAIMLLIASLYLALKSSRTLRDEQLREDLRLVLSSIKEVRGLNVPLVLIPARLFQQLQRLEHYESLRNRKCTVVIDSLDALGKFKEKAVVVFLSHQWLGLGVPDPDGSKLLAMQQVVMKVLDEVDPSKELHVWCDYCCIPQRHNKMQQAAINALPIFASLAEKFVVVAPPAMHSDEGTRCNLETYYQRGWCRAEILARACAHGVEEVYICQDAVGTLIPMEEEELMQLDLNVFEGQFTVQEDIEHLVKPLLGLYSLVIRDHDSPHMEAIHAQMERERDTFFPKSYKNAKSDEDVDLFGRCVDILEAYCAEGDDMTRHMSLASNRQSGRRRRN